MGTTGTGADWCLKALHPSDPLTEVRGIPDHSAVPTICMNYQSTFTLSIHESQTGPWSFDMTMLPHPLYVAYWEGDKAYSPADATAQVGNFWNTQLTAETTPTSDQLLAAWLAMAQRWRITYMSVTAYQDGPDLANQGTLVVSQTPMQPSHFACSIAPGSTNYSFRTLAEFDKDNEGPNFQRSQSMPNAYMGRSREGCYVPLKLTDTCQEWHSQSDLIVPYRPASTSTSGITAVPGSDYQTFPFHSTVPAYYIASGPTLRGSAVPDLMNGGVANISARNLSEETSFTFYFRLGVEMQLAPTSTLTPQLKLSPPHDPTAMDTYFAIARELKDAYPADFNDLGRMWDVISATVKSISPVLRTIPLARRSDPFIKAGLAIGDTVREARKAPAAGDRDRPPQAQVERAQEAVTAMRTIVGDIKKARRQRKAKRKGKAAVRAAPKAK